MDEVDVEVAKVKVQTREWNDIIEGSRHNSCNPQEV